MIPGTRILIIRRRDEFAQQLENSGASIENLELIRTEGIDDSAIAGKLSDLSAYDGLFFTSPAACEVFVRSVDSYAGRIYVLGRRCKAFLESNNFDVIFSENASTADDLIDSFSAGEFAGGRFLYLRGDRSMRAIPKRLSGSATVDELIVYRTVSVEHDPARIDKIADGLANGEFDFVCFFSPSGVERFCDLFGGRIARTLLAAAIGRTTAAAAVERGFEVDFVSPAANASDFASGLIGHIKDLE